MLLAASLRSHSNVSSAEKAILVCAALQRPFTIDGVQGCGEHPEDAGAPGVRQVAPWWVPVSFATATRLDPTWAELSACAAKEPIYTLEVTLALQQVETTRDPSLQSC